MTGMATQRPRSPGPPWPYRIVTLGAGGVVVYLLPEALAAAAQRPVEAIVWLAMASISSLMSVASVPKLDVEASLRTPVSIASVMVLDPLTALLVNLLALVSIRELRPEVSRWKIVYNHVQIGLAAYGAALVLDGRPLGVVAGTLLAVPLFDVANIIALTIHIWLTKQVSLLRAIQYAAMPFPLFATNYVFIGLLALLIVVLYQLVSPWSIVLLAVPLWLGYAALRSAKAASDRADELAERVRELEVLHDLGTALLSSRDPAHVVQLAAPALQEIAGAGKPGDVVLALDGELPEHLDRRPVPGTPALVGLARDVDQERIAEVDTACNSVGLALQRLTVEEELRASQRAEAELAEGILAEGSSARSRVALHVHDDVLPYLAAAAIQAENVITAVGIGNTELTTKLASIVRDAVADGISALREVLDDLQRQTIVPGDLLPSVRRAAEQARVEHGLDVTLDAHEFAGGLSHPVEILLTETVTGLLTNVVRHAEASRVTIRLRTVGSMAVAEVSDDGVGFDPDGVGAGHHGLALMRQRAALAKGEFVVDSRLTGGTTIRLEVPVRTVGLLPTTPSSAPSAPADDAVLSPVPA